MAYVLVQHLDPSHESILAELLAKASRMPVSEVKQDTEVEPNHVYVTPGQNDVTIHAGMLRLVPRTTTRGQHMPVDSFLRTLAEAQGRQGIGVILSGTASDGTEGVKAIKAEGGITFAQDPVSAAYDGMPRSAIASNCVDFVLPPEGIAKELSRLSRHPYVITAPREEGAGQPLPSAAKTKDGLGAILALLRKRTNVDFGSYKPPTIQRRVTRRMALVHMDTLEDYARHLEGNADELQALYQDCLITVTSFFRDPEVFQVLCEKVLPLLLKGRPPGAPIRVWVPGCATGEEVYSIVMCLLERAGELRGNPTFQVFGTDLSEEALDQARSARYPADIAQDVAPERLQRFFTEVGGRYQVAKAIRDLCVFARHDLTRDPPFGRMDLISCRNMLIYLEPRVQQRVMSIFHYALRPSGFLMLGASETAGASHDLFAPVDTKQRIYSKRPTATPSVLGFARPLENEQERQRQEGRPGAAVTGLGEELPREADRILLARYAPAGVIVDEKDNIVDFRGQTDAYLEHAHGRATLNLFKMARKGLLLEVRQAVQEARKKEAPVRKEGVSLRQRGQVRHLDLEVIPLKGSSEKEHFLLVLFEARPEAKVQRGGHPQPHRRAATAVAKENAKLRQELDDATRFLQAVMQEHEAANEELQASNEEVLSANEELQSINEELETAKEELQSTNEELVTLNQELQDRNLQYGRALEYANGIVETVRHPLLILDADLRVERANRAFYEYFRVTAEETVGRLVTDVGDRQWDIPALRQALAEILPRAATLDGFEIEHEFPRIGRRTLVVNARALGRENGQQSILLAFEDRTEIQKTGREREALLGLEQQARQRAEQADRMKDEFVATLSHELRGPLSAMVGWVDVLRAGGSEDPAIRARGMAAIERGARAQTRLVEDLLDYSRMVVGRLPLATRLMDLVPAVEAAVEAVRSAVAAKGIRLELATEAKPAMVHADPDRLQQILWNLLSNAVKFTPRDGRVDVWVGRVGTTLHVRVSDNGNGLSAAFLPHVFERFRQADSTSRRQEGGLGLGLAIVKELVELHGGAVQAASPGEGQGATFTVVLPIPALLMEPKDGEAEAIHEPSLSEAYRAETDRTMLDGVRVLVVEDEADGREMLVTVFEQHGAKVSAASSAADAMKDVRREAPDVLVCDVGLPGEDGHELIRRVRAFEADRGGRIAALALTAYAGVEDRRRALEAGFDLHVPKPAPPAELVAKVALLAGPRTGR